MNRITVAATALALAMLAGEASAQSKSLKDRLLGKAAVAERSQGEAIELAAVSGVGGSDPLGVSVDNRRAHR